MSDQWVRATFGEAGVHYEEGRAVDTDEFHSLRRSFRLPFHAEMVQPKQAAK